MLHVLELLQDCLRGEGAHGQGFFALIGFMTQRHGLQGIYFPSSSDNGSNNSIVYDFFWGTYLLHIQTPLIAPSSIEVNHLKASTSEQFMILCLSLHYPHTTVPVPS